MAKNLEMPSDEKSQILLLAVEDRKAVEPLLLDLRDKTVMTDFFLICSGTSDTHIRAIADLVQERGEEAHVSRPRTMGQSVGEWILIDFGDVVVHVMSQEARERYALEKFWTTPQPHGALPPTPDSVSGAGGGLDAEADSLGSRRQAGKRTKAMTRTTFSFFEAADKELEPLEDEDLDLGRRRRARRCPPWQKLSKSSQKRLTIGHIRESEATEVQ